MSTRAVIAVKAPELGKERLACCLDAHARARLVEVMLGHVAATARAAVADVMLIGACDAALTPALPRLADPGGGLNAACATALARALGDGVTRLIILPGDLPLLTCGDVTALAALPAGTLGLAPDRHGTGTNALSLPLPLAAPFAFAFGPGSRTAHRLEGLRLGLPFEELHSPGLARDIDLPQDLADLPQHWPNRWQGREPSGDARYGHG